MGVEQRTASLREGTTHGAVVYKRWRDVGAVFPVTFATTLKLLHIGGAGTVTFTNQAGDTATVTAIAGMYIPADIKTITAATATGMVGYW